MDGTCHGRVGEGCSKEFITPENIIDLFRKYGSPETPDYVSIDIDSTDVWVFTNLTTAVRPRVLTVEYKCQPDIDTIMETEHQSSLAAVYHAARQAGYSLVGVEPSLDAFLVRSDLVCEGKEIPLKTFKNFAGVKFPLIGTPKATSQRRFQSQCVGECVPSNWTLKSFPCDPHKDKFCCLIEGKTWDC